MDKWKNIRGYISVEVVIVIAIILIGGLIGITKYTSKGKETTSKTNDTVAKVYKDYGGVDLSPSNSSNNTNNNSSNTSTNDNMSSIIQLKYNPTSKVAINSIEFPKGVDEIKVDIIGKNLISNSSKIIGNENKCTSEFGQFTDIAPIVDKYGEGTYALSFDIKSFDTSKTNQMRVYGQNGEKTKYRFTLPFEQNGYLPSGDGYNGILFNVTEQWERHKVIINLKNSSMNA